MFPLLESKTLVELEALHSWLKLIGWIAAPSTAIVTAVVVLWYSVFLDKVGTKIDELKADEQRANTPVREGLLVPGSAERPEFTYRAVPLPPGLPPDIEAELKEKLDRKRPQPPKDMPILLLGDHVVRTPEKHFPKCIIRQENEDMMTLEQSSEGLSVSAKFFNSEGKIVCELLKNRFALNNNNVFRIERKNPSHLILQR